MPRLKRVAAVTAAGLLGAAAVALLAARPYDGPSPAVRATTPAAGATVSPAPAAVEVAFTDPVDTSRSHISVRDGSGAVVAVGGPRLVTPQRLRQPVHIVTSGEVTVVYHVTFVDGAQLAGTVRFRAEPGQATAAGQPPAGTVTGGAAAEAAHEHGIDPISAALLLTDGIVALVAVVLLMRRPPTRAPNGD